MTRDAEQQGPKAANRDVAEAGGAAPSGCYDHVLQDSLSEIYVFAADTLRFVAASRGALENLGYSVEELRSLTPVDLDPEATAESFAERVEPLRVGKEERVTFTSVHRRKDGSHYPVEIHLQRMPRGDTAVFVELVLDATERRRTEEALDEERNRLRSVVDALDGMEGMLTIQDREFNIVYQNGLMERTFGGLGDKCYKVYEGNEHVCTGCPVQKAFRDGRSYNAEREVRADNGEIVYFDNSAHPVRNAAGEVTSCVEVVRNITDRKLAEKERERTTQRQQRLNSLQQSLLGPGSLAEQLKRITDGVVEIFDADFCRIWITQPGDRCSSGCMHAVVTEGPHVCRHRDRCLWLLASSGRYTHLDGEVHRRVPFGCYKIGLVAAGDEPRFLTNDATSDPRVHNHDWARELGVVSFAGLPGSPAGGRNHRRAGAVSRSTRSRRARTPCLRASATPLPRSCSGPGSEEGYHTLQLELRDASREAGMAEVATGVLHNVGNVLNSVNVSASIVSEKVRSSKATALGKAVELIRENGDNLANFICADERGKQLPRFLGSLAEALAAEQAMVLDELQSLSANIDHIRTIVTAQQTFAGTAGLVEAVRLADVLEDALRLEGPSLQRYAHEVVRDCAELPPVEMDKQRVLQILINLIRNASHAMADRGSGGGKLILRAARDGESRVRIDVVDNGVGIAEENLTRIFAHGFTTRQARGGRGFGLHHSALSAQEMGGSLTAQSDGPGTGATFTLTLPIKAKQTAE